MNWTLRPSELIKGAGVIYQRPKIWEFDFLLMFELQGSSTTHWHFVELSSLPPVPRSGRFNSAVATLPHDGCPPFITTDSIMTYSIMTRITTCHYGRCFIEKINSIMTRHYRLKVIMEVDFLFGSPSITTASITTGQNKVELLYWIMLLGSLLVLSLISNNAITLSLLNLFGFHIGEQRP